MVLVHRVCYNTLVKYNAMLMEPSNNLFMQAELLLIFPGWQWSVVPRSSHHCCSSTSSPPASREEKAGQGERNRAIAKSFIQKATHGEMVSYITTHVTPHTAKTIHYNVRKISILFLTTVGNYIITLYGTDDTLYV